MFDENDINERVYWLIYQLHMSYEDIMNMPWETMEWIYRRHVQQLVDMQQEQNKQNGVNHFI